MWPWLTKALKGVGSAILGGIGSGLARRTETQLAGSKAAGDYAGTGGGAGVAAQTQYTYGTQQESSQGQSQAFQTARDAKFQTSQQGFASSEAAKQRQHEMNMLTTEYALRNAPLSTDGDSSNGQIGPLVPVGPGFDQMNRQSRSVQGFKKHYRRPLPRVPAGGITDVGTTRQGRHYGSSW